MNNIQYLIVDTQLIGLFKLEEPLFFLASGEKLIEVIRPNDDCPIQGTIKAFSFVHTIAA